MSTRKRKSKHQPFVEDWCLQNEMIPEVIDDMYVLKAKVAYQRVARMIPGKEYFKVKSTATFNDWSWRSVVIRHFIGKEDTFSLFLLLMLHTKSDFFTYSYLLSEPRWESLFEEVISHGKTLFDKYSALVSCHLRDVINDGVDVADFPVTATYLESFLSTELYIEFNSDCDLRSIRDIDETGVFENYEALVTSVYLLNIYSNYKKESEGTADARIIESCARATDYLLLKQPEPYTESFREVTTSCLRQAG